jgi:glutamate-1-semialdehyde 2,1-aminomutase
MSVLAGRRELMERLHETYVSSTFFTNSIAMAAAVATIRKLRQIQAIPHLWRIGQCLLDGLDRLAREAGVEARGVGVAPMPFLVFTDPDPAVRETAKCVFYRETTRRGLLLHPNHHWFVCAAHTDQDLAHTLEVCREAFCAVNRELARGYRTPARQETAVTVSTGDDRSRCQKER